MNRPKPQEYAEYYNQYISKVPEGNILEILENQIELTKKLFSNINEEKSLFRYEENKWSIRELLGHVIDTERIFAYRILRFSRNDKTNLPSFEQNNYVPNSNHNNITLCKLLEEFYAVRKSNLLLFKSFSEEMWNRTGIANNNPATVNAFVYILAGHFIHHINIIEQKYL